MKTAKKGFTLVEVLIVLIILGLLVAMAVPAVLKLRQGAIENQVRMNLSLVAKTGAGMILEKEISQIDFKDLPNIQDKVSSVNGEDYSGLTVYAQGGDLTVTLSNGQSITYTYTVSKY